jgi:glycosyltransferase involved in cell wall biosynthesis
MGWYSGKKNRGKKVDMKILFICGSLEPGRDGVGDYIRRLAGELLRLGHTTAALSLNDKYVKTISEEFQYEGNEKIPVCRVPSTATAWKNGRTSIKRWIDAFDPDYTSLQYVPFAFHPKGLPFFWVNRFARLGKGRKWHIMFHELWVGMEQESAKKELVWGKVQRYIAQYLAYTLKPDRMHTQTHLYLRELEKAGLHVDYLPLFGNISLLESSQNKVNIDTPEEENKACQFVIFGGIHSGAPVKEFVRMLADFAKVKGMQAEFIFLGRNGKELENWVEICGQHGIKYEVLGEQPVDKISEALSKADLGIATTPHFLVEKSGSIAAMMEHGLPVICVAKQWTPRIKEKIGLPDMVIPFPGSTPDMWFKKRGAARDYRSVTTIANQFISSLNEVIG